MEKSKFDYLEKGIGQIALVVPNLERAVEVYWNQFGIGPWQFFTYQAPLLKKMSYRGQRADFAFRIALASIGELRMELIELIRGNTIHAEFVKKHGYGVHHLGMFVDDIEKAIANAKNHGIEMIMDGEGWGVDGDGHFAYLDTEDLIGITLEFIQRPKQKGEPDKVYPSLDS